MGKAQFQPLKVLCTVFLGCVSISNLFAQTISVDVSQVIRTIPENAIGINMNYLMDGSFINANTPAATAATLKKMKVKLLRYPGGEKSDNYLWSIPPFDAPDPRVALTGNCHFPSGDSRFVNGDFTTLNPAVLDFDEFMLMCKDVGAEPIIVCAYDAAYYGSAPGSPTPSPCGTKATLSELVTTAKEWVRYANITKGYSIKYWSIGNESWHECTYNGCVPAAQYAIDIQTFATAMRAVDPTIRIIVNGRGTGWWKTLLESPAASQIDYFGVSCYPINNYAGGYETYRTSNPDLLNEAGTAAAAIQQYAVAGDKDRVKVIATEYNAIDFTGVWPNTNDVGHALMAFETVGQQLSNTSVDGAVFWNTRWIDNTTSQQHVFDALDQLSNTNANGTALSIWGNHMLPDLVRSASSGAGSNFIKTFSMYDNATGKLNVFVINKDNSARTVDISLPGFSPGSYCSTYTFKGTSHTDKFPTYALQNATPEQVNSYPYSVSVPRNSITVFSFQQLTALPLDLISFGAVLQTGKKAMLSWTTASAACGNRYLVQSSTNGEQWSKLADIPAHCDNQTAYEFRDDLNGNPAGKVFYRIGQTDAQGRHFYSAIRTINLDNSNEPFTVRIRSQPVVTWLEPLPQNAPGKHGEILIYNLAGKKIKAFSSVRFDQPIKLNVQALPPGLYVVEVKNGVFSKTIKMMKW